MKNIDTQVIPANSASIRRAIEILKMGGIVAFPTDTVYGIAAFPFVSQYVEGLYVAKGRSETKSIAILLSHPSELSRVAFNLNEDAIRLAEAFFPGPLTLVVPRNPAVPEIVSQRPTIGVRIPDHPVALSLLKASGPLAVTSANRSGEPDAITAQHVFNQLCGRIHLILDGGTSPGGTPSTVVDCTQSPPVILRAGPITQEQISKVVNK